MTNYLSNKIDFLMTNLFFHYKFNSKKVSKKYPMLQSYTPK